MMRHDPQWASRSLDRKVRRHLGSAANTLIARGNHSETAIMSPPQTPAVRLPHPYLTAYAAEPAPAPHSHRLVLAAAQPAGATLPPQPLHNEALSFTLPAATPGAPSAESDNTPFARARRSPHTTVSWSSAAAPSVGQLWLLAYALFTGYHAQETLRLTLDGAESSALQEAALAVQLVLPHPHLTTPAMPCPDTVWTTAEVLLSRATFWQGAGSPFGVRAAWVADPSTRLPAAPSVVEYTFTTLFPRARVHVRHPVRPPKPAPGSVIYSRWIPHLDEVFSMVALDWRDAAHLAAFHRWQNDPHVAKGWRQTGSVDEHRAYLRDAERDPHVLAVLGRFDDELFGYFEVYWGAEDHLGAHYRFDDWDRGRHSLVGNSRLRGAHRVRAWWSGLMHYCFLDDPRTQRLVGEPRESNDVVAQYDRDHGFWHEGTVDLPHKRARLAMVSREQFFKLAALHWGDESGVGEARDGKVQAKL